MITVDLIWAVAVFLSIGIIALVSHWIWRGEAGTDKKGVSPSDARYFQHCPYCTHLFFNYDSESLKMCPRCKSYITPEEKTPLANGGESGVVLITVVVLIMVMSILAIGVMGTNVSQSLSNQHQIDRIKAEQLAKGAFWDSYMKILRGIDPVANPTPSETLDNKDFTVDVDVVAGPPDEYLLSVDWPE